MNMILGPNGTGKSSIACALCVGLGFPVSVRSSPSSINPSPPARVLSWNETLMGSNRYWDVLKTSISSSVSDAAQAT